MSNFKNLISCELYIIIYLIYGSMRNRAINLYAKKEIAYYQATCNLAPKILIPRCAVLDVAEAA